MPSEGSITQWLHRLQAGDPEGAQRLWERYFHRLVGLARKKLDDLPRRAADEEDVALSAFHSFCRGAERGRFPQLSDRDNLWRLLFAITARKAFDLVRDEHRQKRGGGAVLGESALLGPGDSADEQAGLELVLDREPTPAFAARWPRSTSVCWTAWTTRNCVPSPCGKWKAIQRRRSPSS